MNELIKELTIESFAEYPDKMDPVKIKAIESQLFKSSQVRKYREKKIKKTMKKVMTKYNIPSVSKRVQRKFVFFWENQDGHFVFESAGEYKLDLKNNKNLTDDQICRRRLKQGNKKTFDWQNITLWPIEVTDWVEDNYILFEKNKINNKGKKRSSQELHKSIQTTVENTILRKVLTTGGYSINRPQGTEVHKLPPGKTIKDAFELVNEYLFGISNPRIFEPREKTTKFLLKHIRKIIKVTRPVIFPMAKYLYGVATGVGKTADFLFGCQLWMKLTKHNVHLCVTSMPDTRKDLCRDVRDGKPFQNIIVWVPDKHYKDLVYLLKERVRPFSQIKDIHNLPDNNHVISLGVQDARGEEGEKYKDILEQFKYGVYGKDEVHTNQGEFSKFATNVEKYLTWGLAVYMTGTPEQFVLEYSEFTEENRHLFLMNDVYIAKKEGDPDFIDVPWRNIMINDFEGAQLEVARILNLEDDELHTLKKQWSWDTVNKLFTHETAVRELIKIRFGVGVYAGSSRCFWGTGSGLAKYSRKVGIVCIESGNIKEKGFHLKKIIKEEVGIKVFSAHESRTAYDDFLNFCNNTDEDCVYITHDKDMTGKNNKHINWGWFSLNINSVVRANQGCGRFVRKLLGKTDVYIFFDNPNTAFAITIDPIEAISDNPGTTIETAQKVSKVATYWLEGSERWEKAEVPDIVKHINDNDPIGTRGLFSYRHINPNAECPIDLVGVINAGKVSRSASQKLSNTIASQGKNKIVRKKKLNKNEISKWNNEYRKSLSESIGKLSYAVIHTDLYTLDSILKNPTISFNGIDKTLEEVCGTSLSFSEIQDAIDKDCVSSFSVNRSLAKVRTHFLDILETGLVEDLLESFCYIRVADSRTNFVAEPINFVKTIIEKLLNVMVDDGVDFENTTFGDICAGRGSFLIAILILAKKYNFNILPKNIYYNDIDPTWVEFFKKINKEYKLGIPEENIFNEDVFNPSQKFKEILMKGFDVTLGNWPFGNKNNKIWDKFDRLVLDKNKINTKYVLRIAPSGWRNVDGNQKDIQRKIFKEMDLLYLEMYDESGGLDTFGKETRFDWALWKNSKTKNLKTEIKFQDGSVAHIYTTNLEFLPNYDYEKYNSQLASGNEERVEVSYDRSMYGTDKPHMSRENVSEYPCSYTINNEGILTNGNGENRPWYSSIKKGHFGIPKLIWSNGRITSIGSYVDDTGKYGLTQYSYAIVDTPENLPLIKKAFDSEEFRSLMMSCAVTQNQINYKVISLFKKDFWREFI
jgi:predicted RNA methylase